MAKYLPVLFILLSHTYISFSQDGTAVFTKNYFRPNPFGTNFSSFLKQLLNDPGISNKQIRQRTDTSLFYFSGNMSNYNRFFFKPIRVNIVFAQVAMQYAENGHPDTIFIYSLLAYADSVTTGEQEVKKEFGKIHRLFNKKFIESNFQDIKNGETKTGEVRNYFINAARLAPVSIAWGKSGTNQYALNLVVRLKTENNQAILPVTFDHP